MGSRQKTGSAGARLPELSRSAAPVGATAAFVLAAASATAEADPTISICERWVATTAEIDQLEIAWARYERTLCLKYNWRQLSQSEQSDIPAGRTLEVISERIDALGWECDALVRALPTTPAQSTLAVIATLTVAAGLFYPDENPDAHGLVTRAIRDLKVLSGASGRA